MMVRKETTKGKTDTRGKGSGYVHNNLQLLMEDQLQKCIHIFKTRPQTVEVKG